MTPHEAMRSYQQALLARNLDQTMALIADDAVYLFSNETSHIGKAAIERAIDFNFQTIRNETYEVRGLHWLVNGEAMAACVYQFHWTGEINGQEMSGNGRGTNVLRREDDGSWKIVHEHLSKGKLGTTQE